MTIVMILVAFAAGLLTGVGLVLGQAEKLIRR